MIILSCSKLTDHLTNEFWLSNRNMDVNVNRLSVDSQMQYVFAYIMKPKNKTLFQGVLVTVQLHLSTE